MKQILAPFQIYECFEVEGEQYLVTDYLVIHDRDHKLVEWCSYYKFKRLRDHKHYDIPFTKVLNAYREGKAKHCR